MPANIIGQTLLNQFRVDAFIESGTSSYILRGRSWASEYRGMYLVTATSRLWNNSYVSSDVLGFRCATSSP